MSLPRRQQTARSTRSRTARRPGRGVTVALALTAAVGAAAVQAPAAQAAVWPGHPDRSVVRYVVRAGDTATGLAVRYHAWTAELLSLNHLTSKSRLRQGQELRIPVVLSAVRRAKGIAEPRPATSKKPAAHPPLGKGWRHDTMTREQVRRLVTRTAKRLGVPPRLALAVAWQESGWQQRRISSTGALGVMQVMPDTGRWMRLYVGRRLHLRDTHDNVLAGVMVLRVLRDHTRKDDNAIAAYYQGLGAVRRHGYFEDTVMYVAAVRAHERRITRTGSPV